VPGGERASSAAPVTGAALRDELAYAVRRYGGKAFDRDGPQALMDFATLLDGLRQLPAIEASAALRDVAHRRYKDRGLRLASALLARLQDWDALFDQPGMEALLAGKKPPRIRSTPRAGPIPKTLLAAAKHQDTV
jgi:hypothetical protein